MENYGKSVYLLENQCKGCTNCIKHCPTQAIRVRNGKAVITTDQCIDCGECIRICPHHAKKAKRGFIDAINHYDYTVALRAVWTSDFMTCEYAPLPHKLLARVSTRITNEVKGINRVVYDITGKPPATIEWE